MCERGMAKNMAWGARAWEERVYCCRTLSVCFFRIAFGLFACDFAFVDLRFSPFFTASYERCNRNAHTNASAHPTQHLSSPFLKLHIIWVLQEAGVDGHPRAESVCSRSSLVPSTKAVPALHPNSRLLGCGTPPPQTASPRRGKLKGRTYGTHMRKHASRKTPPPPPPAPVSRTKADDTSLHRFISYDII